MHVGTFSVLYRSSLQPSTMITSLVLAVACVLSPTAACAATIDATKSVTWYFDNLPSNTARGEYGLITLSAAVDGGAFQSTPPFNSSWLLKNGLSYAAPSAKAGPGPKGSTAQADMDFAATKPDPGDFGYTITGTIHTKVQADAGKDGNAVATSNGYMQILGGTITGVQVTKGGKTVGVNAANFKNEAKFGASSAGAWHDPISLSFMDLTSGEAISQDLFEMDMQSMAAGLMSWGPGGFELDAPLDGMSSVSFRLLPLSAWITDPSLVDSRLSFAGGVFNATGIFANLPWIVKPGMVTLPGGLLDSISVPYQVPTGLINATDVYLPSLNLTESAQVAEGTPEPASAWLVSIVLAGFAAKAWRHRARKMLFSCAEPKRSPGL